MNYDTPTTPEQSNAPAPNDHGFNIRPGESILAAAAFKPEAVNYYILVNTVGLAVVVALIALPLAFVTFGISLIALVIPAAFIGVTRWYYTRYYANLKCVLTNRALRVRTGVWNITEKAVPLDKVTDLQMDQGFIMRRFDLEKIKVETAGQSSGPGGSLVNLVGIENSHAFRERVLEQRDLVVGSAESNTPTSPPTPAPNSATSTMPTDERVIELLTEIRDALRER